MSARSQSHIPKRFWRCVLPKRPTSEGRGINFVCTQSDLHDVKCTGPRLSVIACHSERLGWHVSVANICECDEFGGSVVDVDAIPEMLTLPFWMKWIVPLILPIIFDTSTIPNKNLRHALLAYGKEHLLTYLILQEARTKANAQLFGIAEDYVKYAEGMKSELKKDSHVIELMYMTRKETICNVEHLVIGEELLHLRSVTNGTLDRDERRQFWSKWKSESMPCSLISLVSRPKLCNFSMACSFCLHFCRRLFPSYKHY